MDYFINRNKYLFIALIAALISGSLSFNHTYTKLYQDGIQAYRAGRWFECFERVQEAIDLHHKHQKQLIQCRLLCQRSGTLPDLDTLSTIGYVIAINTAECSKRCLRDGGEVEGPRGDTGDTTPVDQLDGEFEKKIPYDYLQICAYHVGKISTAISAAYTFSIWNPDHEYMPKNLELYRTHPEASDSYLINMEQQKHQELFELGARYYNAQDFENTVVTMEEVLKQYYKEDEWCSALCDEPVDDNRLNQISKSDTDLVKGFLFGHWISVLQCKAQCPVKLANIRGKYMENYLVELYNYLQFSYYKLNQYKNAAQCTGTYLMMLPDSGSMMRNKDVYLTQPEVSVKDFEPRQDAKNYFNKKERERLMLEELFRKLSNLGSNKFIFILMFPYGNVAGLTAVFLQSNACFLKDLHARLQEETVPNTKTSRDAVSVATFNIDNPHYAEPIEDFMTSRGLVVTMEAETLLGQHRVVIDGLLSKQGCENLVQIYKTSSTDKESEDAGVTLDAAAALARAGKLSPSLVYQYLNTVDLCRSVVEKYFQVVSPLLYQHSRIFCCQPSTPEQGEDDETVALLETEDDDDYIAFLYLTDDFTGGEFSFTLADYKALKVISPLIGRLVASNGANHYDMLHVNTGERCVLAMTYTRNPANQLPEYSRALITLKQMDAPDWVSPSSELTSFSETNGYKVLQTERDLNGPGRFTADNLATADQCQKLINLASKMAVAGDGYSHNKARSSPHTDHEKFVGLTVKRAAELAAGYTVSAEAVELYVRISEQALEFTRLYFNVDELYFAYIHLVCRTALDDSVTRADLSHPIHTDNSVMQPDGTTIRMRPAYIERDYSAIVYLNGDFKGGDFFFAHQNFSIQSAIHPHCGMMVSFDAGNYHGVRAVEAGQRCAIALWFTKDKQHEDTSALFAHEILNQLSSNAFGPNRKARHTEL